MIHRAIIFYCVCVSFFSMSQTVRYGKIQIDSGSALHLTSDSTFIDTLIMKDNSVVRFLTQTNVLVVKSAFIGYDCLFDGKGENGKDATIFQINGQDAVNGKSLLIVVGIEKLGSLLVDTRGGVGGNGLSGETGQANGTYGKNGGNGGGGGNGGDITFYYGSPNFITNINRPLMDHSIQFILDFGAGGKGGAGGKKGSNGEAFRISSTTPPDPKVLTTRTYSSYTPIIPAGTQGSAGSNGKHGELKFLKVK